jgi:hypothetical protein
LIAAVAGPATVPTYSKKPAAPGIGKGTRVQLLN